MSLISPITHGGNGGGSRDGSPVMILAASTPYSHSTRLGEREGDAEGGSDFWLLRLQIPTLVSEGHHCRCLLFQEEKRS